MCRESGCIDVVTVIPGKLGGSMLGSLSPSTFTEVSVGS